MQFWVLQGSQTLCVRCCWLLRCAMIVLLVASSLSDGFLVVLQVLSSTRLEDLMLFLVVFIGSPKYVRSPYLRSKLSEVIHAWLPQQQDSPTSFRRK